MPLPFGLRRVEDQGDLRKIKQFVLSRDLGYPGYREWVEEKLEPRLSSGEALGIIATHETVVIGNTVIYVDPVQKLAEFKNFRVADDHADEGIGTILWRQSELEARKASLLGDDEPLTLVLDTPEDNVVALEFFRRRHCVEVGRQSLYTPERLDVKLAKQVLAPRRRAA